MNIAITTLAITQTAISFIVMVAFIILMVRDAKYTAYEKNTIRNIVLASIVYTILGSVMLTLALTVPGAALVVSVIDMIILLLTSLYVTGMFMAALVNAKDYEAEEAERISKAQYIA